MLDASSLMRDGARLRTGDKGVEMNRQARRREKFWFGRGNRGKKWTLRSSNAPNAFHSGEHSGERLKKALSQKTIADVKKDFCLARYCEPAGDHFIAWLCGVLLAREWGEQQRHPCG
jgi:hypothetical protein